MYTFELNHVIQTVFILRNYLKLDRIFYIQKQ